MSPIASAEEMLKALRDYTSAETQGAKDEAARRYVIAEEKHMFSRLGVERAPRGVMQRVILPAILIFALVVSLLLNIGLSIHTAQNTDDLQTIQREGVISNRESCERTNDARVASIAEKRQSVVSLQKQLAFWHAAIAQSKGQPKSPIIGVFLTFVESLQEELATKREGIASSIASQADVAIKPGSPIANCARAYPFH